MRISFLGAAGTVTGSKYLLQHEGRHLLVVHGEANAADTLRRRISLELGWSVSVPEYRDSLELQP